MTDQGSAETYSRGGNRNLIEFTVPKGTHVLHPTDFLEGNFSESFKKELHREVLLPRSVKVIQQRVVPKKGTKEVDKMPWHMEPSGTKGMVYVVDDRGKRYEDKPIPKWRAKKQMAALYAAEPQAKAFAINGPIPGQINYWDGEKWQDVEKASLMKDGLPASAFLVVEDPQKVTTWHLPVKDAQGKPDRALMGAAHAALLSPGGHRGNKYEGPGKGAAIAKLRKMYEAEGMKFPGEKSFSVFKQADGQYRWVTISSSAFRDRDGELITAQALAQDVERCDTNKSYGPLRWWHIGGWEAPDGPERWDTWKAAAGVDLGTCDFNMLHGKMLIESGTFKDAVTGEAFAEAQDNLEVSIAFSHPADEPGHSKSYNNIHRFERSLLPAGMASNLLTKTYVLKGDVSMKTAQKFEALLAILRNKPDMAKQILDDAENVQKAAEAAGLEYKEVEEMISDPVPVAEEEPAAPAAEEVKKPEEVPTPETPETPEAEKAAPPPPPAQPVQPAPDEIGDMTRQELADFCAKVYQQMMTKKDAEIELKQAGRDQIMSETLVSLKTLGERVEAIGHTLDETKQELQELADARPVGIKQMQSMRPTERVDNITTVARTGPQIDPEFIKFALGGK